MRPFLLLSLLAYAFIVGRAYLRRPRFIATFLAIVLGVHTLNSVLLEPVLAAYGPLVTGVYWYGQVVSFVYIGRMTRRRTHPRAYRWFVSWPASWFLSAIFLALPWAVCHALSIGLALPWLPFAIAAGGFAQSLFTRPERRSIVLDRKDAGSLKRQRSSRQLPTGTPLRIVQITDPHLGPFMSEARLRGICERAVREQPDLILLTGDYLTVESQRSAEPLARALSPLAELPGRVFACFGNHDHESPELVKHALQSAGVTLLLDEVAEVSLPWGEVQIVGADYHFRGRDEALSQLAVAYPRKPGALRLWLLHDPGAFRCIPEGEADLVLSGHTHGGHLGLLSLGLRSTIVSAATNMPDHGLWGRGRDRLYVHRGTGHYGFPLRIGVPAEESVLEVYYEPVVSEEHAASVRNTTAFAPETAG